jgi:threonine dehydratase
MEFSAAVVVPVDNSVEKNAAMRSLGVEVIEQGRDFQECPSWTRSPPIAAGTDSRPFTRRCVRGVGTYALELFRGPEPTLFTCRLGWAAVCAESSPPEMPSA